MRTTKRSSEGATLIAGVVLFRSNLFKKSDYSLTDEVELLFLKCQCPFVKV